MAALKKLRLKLSLIPFAISAVASAQNPESNYPTRPVTVVVVVTPGGSAETQSRVYTPKLSENLGRPVVFDFKPGAGGTIGYTFVSKAAPDGHTLLAGSNAFSTVPALMKLQYDPIKDFAPVALLGRQDGMLVVNPSLPIRNVKEYIAYAKANPGSLNWGTSGSGSTAHLTGAWLNELTNTETTFVHYKGSQLVSDLVSGRIQVTGGAFINVSPLVKSGKLRAIGMASSSRSPAFPDVPTMREQGLEWDYPSWLGFIAPAGTPIPIITRLNSELAKIQKLPETQSALEKLGVTSLSGSPADFGRHLSEEIGRWKRLVENTGIKIEE